ncbi:hypothetical protein OIO90_002377 [Microbotryomycetes sp. JL221]|nr:hypothetical protein OIO90_002377 [Microbotryomycetes sp. JL221]
MAAASATGTVAGQHQPQQPTSQSFDSLSTGNDAHSNRVDVINTAGGRILCIADIRGAISILNALAAEHGAVAIIHTGDFGFYERTSLGHISDRTLKHVIQYSSLISPQLRSQLLSPNTSPGQMRELLANTPKHLQPTDIPPSTSGGQSYFGLSEFPKLLAGEIQLNVPVYTVWGACEDVTILEKIRLAAPSELTIPVDPIKVSASAPTRSSKTPGYSIPNLTVLDEATTRLLTIGGLKLRLFGLGGAVVQHKLFDNGQGSATIAGGSGTMWTTVLQIGELVDSAQKVYDPTEVRLLVTHASPGREGLLTQLALTLKADLTVSAGLHFRYGVSYNEFVVHHDVDSFRSKLESSKKSFNEVWESVKSQVESVVDDNQRLLLDNALAVANRSAPSSAEDAAYKNTWNWNLPDASFGSLVLNVREGRVSSELKSQGFNFAYRATAKSSNAPPTSSSAPKPQRTVSSTAPAAVSAPVTSSATPGSVDSSASAPSIPTGPRAQQHHHQQSNGFNSRGTPRGPAGSSFHMRAPSGPGMGTRGGGGRFGGGWGRQNDNNNNNNNQPSSPNGGIGVSSTDETEQKGNKTTTTNGDGVRAAATAVTAEAAQAVTVPVPSNEGQQEQSNTKTTSIERNNTSSPSSTNRQQQQQQQNESNSIRQPSRNYRDKNNRFNNNQNRNNGEQRDQSSTNASTAESSNKIENISTSAVDANIVTPTTPVSSTGPTGERPTSTRGSGRGGRGRGSERGGRGGRGGSEFSSRGSRGGRGRGGFNGHHQTTGTPNVSGGGGEDNVITGSNATTAAAGDSKPAESSSGVNENGGGNKESGDNQSGGQQQGRPSHWRASPGPREPRKW